MVVAIGVEVEADGEERGRLADFFTVRVAEAATAQVEFAERQIAGTHHDARCGKEPDLRGPRLAILLEAALGLVVELPVEERSHGQLALQEIRAPAERRASLAFGRVRAARLGADRGIVHALHETVRRVLVEARAEAELELEIFRVGLR